MAKTIRILGIWNKGTGHYPTFEETHFTPALKQLGYQLKRCPTERISNASLIDEVKKFKPDYLLMQVYKDEIHMETIRCIRDMGVTTICWNGDDEHQWNINKSWATSKIAPFFDYCITTNPLMKPKYRKLGIPTNRIIVSQWGANQEIFKPRKLERIHDTSFVGAYSRERHAWINKIGNHYPATKVFGFGWIVGENSDLSQLDYAKVFNETKINLNYGFTYGTGKKQLQIKGRDFEVPMSGGFLLTSYNEALKPYFKFGKEIETYKDIPELVKKVKYYLKHDKEREAIALAGYKRSIKEHKFSNRFKQIFNEIYEATN